MRDMIPRPFTEERLTDLLERPNTVWRHDVDLSLPAAIKMAALEYAMGIKATYYLMVNSPGYLPSDAFLAMLTLHAFGHRVGLHVDERHWSPNEGLLTGIDAAAPVSFHCPTEAVLWKNFPGIENAYAPEWEGRYYADSLGTFRFGDPEDHPDDSLLQINLHPEWWFEPEAHLQLPFGLYQDFFYIPHPDYRPEDDGPGDRPAMMLLNPDVTDVGCPSCDYGLEQPCTCEE